MTCIVGLVDDEGRIYMGGDSASTAGWDLRRLRESKVFRVGEMLMGVSGSPRMAQLLQHKLALPEHPGTLATDAYLATVFIDAMRTLLKDAGYAQKENEKEKTDSWLLLGYRGLLFFVDSSYSVNTSDKPYEAIGCGDNFALGVLYATEHMMPRKRLQLALEAAEAFSAGVRAPFTYETLEPQESTKTKAS